jgi:hypothetical protein
LEKENFCAVISMNICNDDSNLPPPPQFFIPYHILYRCISCLFYDFTNSLSFRSTTPFSQNFSAVRAKPTPYNFHTLNEIKDLCNMQTDGRTDRRTEIACTLIIIIRGGYNTILCIGRAHCVSFLFFLILFPTPRVHGGLSSLARVVCMKRILSQSLILFPPF